MSNTKYIIDHEVPSNAISPTLHQFHQDDLIATLTTRPDPDLPGRSDLVLTVSSTKLQYRNSQHVAGWIFANTPSGNQYADRLRRCIEGGKAFRGYYICIDVNSEAYISAMQAGFFHKRYLDEELRKLGY